MILPLTQKQSELAAAFLLGSAVTLGISHFVCSGKSDGSKKGGCPFSRLSQNNKQQPPPQGHPPVPDLSQASNSPFAQSFSRLHDEQIEVMVGTVLKEFEATTQDLNNISKEMIKEMEAGLKSGKEMLKMLPSYVTKIPSGTEIGSYLALDLGGSNFRTVRIDLDGAGDYSIESKKFQVPKDVMEGTAEKLFGFIADRLAEFSPECVGDEATSSLLGFTFSFPVDQHALAKGTLIQWTKGFSASGCVGHDVVELLQRELNKRKVHIKIAALVNDTVGTLLAHALNDTNCYIGLILGTGTNAAYLEDAKKISKLGKIDGNMIINIEWGAFRSSSLKANRFDAILDSMSINVGAQPFEKMISGMYLGELCRLALMVLAQEGKLFHGHASETLTKKDTFKTSFMTAIEEDYTPQLRVVRAILERELDINASTLADRIAVKAVVEAVASRAARFSAAGIYAILQKMKRQQVTVAIDGSLFKLYPLFASRLEEAINELNSASSPFKCTLVAAADGSGVGAATAAAMAAAL